MKNAGILWRDVYLNVNLKVNLRYSFLPQESLRMQHVVVSLEFSLSSLQMREKMSDWLFIAVSHIIWLKTGKSPHPSPPRHSSLALLIPVIYQTPLRPRAGNPHSLFMVRMTKGWRGSERRGEERGISCQSDQIIRYESHDLGPSSLSYKPLVQHQHLVFFNRCSFDCIYKHEFSTHLSLGLFLAISSRLKQDLQKQTLLKR